MFFLDFSVAGCLCLSPCGLAHFTRFFCPVMVLSLSPLPPFRKRGGAIALISAMANLGILGGVVLTSKQQLNKGRDTSPARKVHPYRFIRVNLYFFAGISPSLHILAIIKNASVQKAFKRNVYNKRKVSKVLMYMVLLFNPLVSYMNYCKEVRNLGRNP